MASINRRKFVGEIGVEHLQGALTQVTLFGPTSCVWEENLEWVAHINDVWTKQVNISKPKACWGVSAKYLSNGQYVLMYWFENADDAMLFKLMTTHHH